MFTDTVSRLSLIHILAELEQRAGAMGANAVSGVDIDYEVLGADNGMLMVTASGTAVVVD